MNDPGRRRAVRIAAGVVLFLCMAWIVVCAVGSRFDQLKAVYSGSTAIDVTATIMSAAGIVLTFLLWALTEFPYWRRKTVHPPKVSLAANECIGRDSLLAHLQTLLCSKVQNRRVHILHGLGGCGKTTVSIALGQRVAAQGFDVWTIEMFSFNRDIGRLARTLGIAESLCGTPERQLSLDAIIPL